MEMKAFRKIALALLVFVCACASASAQGREMECNDNRWSDRYASHCEIQEQTLPATGGTISVNGGRNGGVSVKGWDRNEILVRARVMTGGKTPAEAAELAKQIRIHTSGADIRAEGPTDPENKSWAVSYEIFAPRQSNVSLETHNGGISISDLRGQIEFKAHNGGVSLRRLAGNVRGNTTNGGISVDLDGDRWDGEGLDVSTRNGGVTIMVPENYSARLESGTRNGGMNLGIPLNAQGRADREVAKEIATDLGAGGALVRVMTTNGGVSIKRK